MPITLEIVTPEARVFSDTVDLVVIPTVEGEVGILPGHIPLLTQVTDGALRIQRGGRSEGLIVGAGFAQVQGDKVSILAENAIEESRVDPDAAEKAMQRAQEALKSPGDLDPAEVERLESVVRFSVAQLGIRKHRR